MYKVKQLIWNNWNIKHIKKHKVSVIEIKEACQSGGRTLETYKKRIIVFGKTKKGRSLTIVLSPIEKNKYYVVSARDISRKERRLLK
jgi:uncharacterized DUF497 family protein